MPSSGLALLEPWDGPSVSLSAGHSARAEITATCLRCVQHPHRATPAILQQTALQPGRNKHRPPLQSCNTNRSLPASWHTSATPQ